MRGATLWVASVMVIHPTDGPHLGTVYVPLKGGEDTTLEQLKQEAITVAYKYASTKLFSEEMMFEARVEMSIMQIPVQGDWQMDNVIGGKGPHSLPGFDDLIIEQLTSRGKKARNGNGKG
jgi:hypothetical protein